MGLCKVMSKKGDASSPSTELFGAKNRGSPSGLTKLCSGNTTTLGRLNAELIEVSGRLPGAAVDVGPGANKGSVSVTFRPEHGCHVVANAGNEGGHQVFGRHCSQ